MSDPLPPGARAAAAHAARHWGVDPEEALGDVLEAAAAGVRPSLWRYRALDGHRRFTRADGHVRRHGSIASVVSLDEVRFRGRHGEEPEALVDTLPGSERVEPDDDGDVLERVLELLPLLPKAQRRAIEGTWLSGRTAVELAEELGVTPCAVFTSRRAAVARLRLMLGIAS